MLDLSQKLPFARSINRLAEQKARDVIALTGRALPASVVSVSGSIVTVKFEVQSGTITLNNVTVPMAGPEWLRFPTRAGEMGVVIPSDYYIGAMSGLGSGTASFSMPANLSALVFMPIGNKGFSTTDDPNKVVLYGPDGAIIRTKDSKSKIDVNENGVNVTMAAGSNFVISSLPTAPGAPGSLWNSAGTVKVS